jgi:hypothetical protein
MKPWNELTDDEIDELEGEDLSWAVGEAMGYEMSRAWHTGKVWAKKPGKACDYWYPTENANLALEVWGNMERVEPTMVVMGGDAVIEVDGAELADTDFCTAICRAYLKVRLADETD